MVLPAVRGCAVSDPVFNSLLNNTFTIARRVRAADGQGGHAVLYTTIGTARGRIRPATSKERETARLEDREITHVLYVVAAGADLARGDLVRYVEEKSERELAVDVLGIREPSLAGHHLEVDCMEHQGEVDLVEEGS